MRMARTLVRVRAIAKRTAAPEARQSRSSLAAGGSGDFGGEVAFFLLDAFAELEAHETLERDRRTDILAGGGDDFGDRGLAVDHEGLREQRIFLAELGDRTIDHLRDRSEEHTSELQSLMLNSYAV